MKFHHGVTIHPVTDGSYKAYDAIEASLRKAGLLRKKQTFPVNGDKQAAVAKAEALAAEFATATGVEWTVIECQYSAPVRGKLR